MYDMDKNPKSFRTIFDYAVTLIIFQPCHWPFSLEIRWKNPEKPHFLRRCCLPSLHIQLTLRLILSNWLFWFPTSVPMSWAMFRRFPTMVEICCMFSSISSSRSSLVILNHTAWFLKKVLTLPDGVWERVRERSECQCVS